MIKETLYSFYSASLHLVKHNNIYMITMSVYVSMNQHGVPLKPLSCFVFYGWSSLFVWQIICKAILFIYNLSFSRLKTELSQLSYIELYINVIALYKFKKFTQCKYTVQFYSTYLQMHDTIVYWKCLLQPKRNSMPLSCHTIFTCACLPTLSYHSLFCLAFSKYFICIKVDYLLIFGFQHF